MMFWQLIIICIFAFFLLLCSCIMKKGGDFLFVGSQMNCLFIEQSQRDSFHPGKPHV